MSWLCHVMTKYLSVAHENIYVQSKISKLKFPHIVVAPHELRKKTFETSLLKGPYFSNVPAENVIAEA